jgi:hypothetical protein
LNRETDVRPKLLTAYGVAVLCWITMVLIGTALGATGGGVYGVLCGAVYGVIYRTIDQLIPLGAGFATAGAIAGAIMGACTPEPKPEDLAVPFFTSYSKTYPGTFPSAVEHNTPDGKTDKRIEPVKEGTDIQGIFFDLWMQEHPQAELAEVPADMVTASGSGLDPHITLKNALYQLDRVAGKWAKDIQRDEAQVRKEIDAILQQKAEAPLGGLVGVKLVNVLEVNLALRDHFRSAARANQ